MYSRCTLGISKVYSTVLGLLVVTNMDSIESAGATRPLSTCSFIKELQPMAVSMTTKRAVP